MTQSTPDDSDKKQAATFFTKWMDCSEKKDVKDENWDEVCLQWCKQQKAARNDQTDPNCSMLCFRRPLLRPESEQLAAKNSWNPLRGYSIVVVNGKEECVTHVNDMKTVKETQVADINEKIATAPSKKYEIDLGNIWTEAGVGAKYVFDEKVVPLYNSAVEQATEWKNSPEAAQMKDYLKEKTDKLYSQVFQTAPPNVNTATPTVETTTSIVHSEDKKN